MAGAAAGNDEHVFSGLYLKARHQRLGKRRVCLRKHGIEKAHGRAPEKAQFQPLDRTG